MKFLRWEESMYTIYRAGLPATDKLSVYLLLRSISCICLCNSQETRAVSTGGHRTERSVRGVRYEIPDTPVPHRLPCELAVHNEYGPEIEARGKGCCIALGFIAFLCCCGMGAMSWHLLWCITCESGPSNTARKRKMIKTKTGTKR